MSNRVENGRFNSRAAAAIVLLAALSSVVNSASSGTGTTLRKSGAHGQPRPHTFFFRDVDDGRTLSLIDIATAAESTDKPLTLILSATLRFSGREIDPPSGYMHLPGTNQRAASALLNGLKHGWLSLRTQCSKAKIHSVQGLDWTVQETTLRKEQAAGEDGLVIVQESGAAPASVVVQHRIAVDADNSTGLHLQTDFLWRETARLRVTWMARRVASGEWELQIEDISQPPLPADEHGQYP